MRERLAAIGAELTRSGTMPRRIAVPGRSWAAGDDPVGTEADPLGTEAGPAATDADPLGPANGRLRPVRLDPGRPGTALLCAVAVVSAALAAGLTWLSRPSVEPIPATPAPVSVVAVASGTASAEATASAIGQEIVVAVVGQVVTPGLVTLPAGSRVADAVSAAGGALPDADLASINLARVLTDGEQVALGVPGAADGSAATPAASGAGPVNLNTASASELESLPGVGPVLAGRIVDWRTDNGGFSSVEDLQEVDGIGPATFEEIRGEVTV